MSELAAIDLDVRQTGARLRPVDERPATTVNGDARISRPGHHDENESGSQQRDAIKVTIQEASVLQGFPADYPWQGSKTSQFRKCGNAVPVPLAKAILSALISSAWGGEIHV